jgi:serine/threonine protein kinase/DNA-binding NarL/FixJ family response regulator
LIADDHLALRVGLRGMLGSQPDFEVVGEATNGVEAVELTEQLHPDVVLMDLRMPEMDGVTATAQIKAKHPDIYILVVTTEDGDADILRAIEAGATGYLLKDAPREELFRAVRATAQGKPLLSPAVAARLVEEVRGSAEEMLRGHEMKAPTPGARDASNKETASRKQVAKPPTGTVTFLFTDIEGSTSMWEKYPAQMQAALARHDEILRSNIEANGGYVFKTVGDAYCAAFITAREALAASLAVQRALFAEEWDEHTEVRVRMALHTGATEERDGDYFGPPINRVARLLSAGHGGQILMSSVTYGLVRDNLEPGAELRDLGEHRLKDLRYTEHIFQLVVPDLPSDFPPLRTLDTRSDERYSLIELIGSGGMAEVYLAHDRELDRDVAFKVLRNQYADDEQFVERFKREARNAALLSHPNIVAIHDRGKTEDGAYYIVMEYVPGDNLKERILRDGPLPAPAAIAIALQVAQALRAAHERGVIHRDVKPQNILLTESGDAKVVDFGLARAVSAVTMTQEGAILGTAHYLSPEQGLGQPASPQSDLYSLGVVLYEMLTGELPHNAETPVGIVMGHISGQLRPPKEVNPDVPESINAVTVRLLARDPKDRYQDAAELIDDLERVQRGEPPAFIAQQQAASPANTPAHPSTGLDLDPKNRPRPPEQQQESDTPPASPPLARPGGVRDGDRRRRVLRWGLVAVLVAVAMPVGVGIIAWLLVPYIQPYFQPDVRGGIGENSKPAPGYDLMNHRSGALSVEVPEKWSERITNNPSEGEKARAGWDSFAGESVTAMTAANDLNSWRTGTKGHQGMYIAASKKLAQSYTDDQLVALGPHDYSSSCQAGNLRDFNRPPYSGKIQEWNNCGGQSNHTALTLSAAPEGRECVVLLLIGGYLQGQEESIQHILDTFKADCSRVD